MLDGGVNESQEDQFAQQLALVVTPIKDWNIHLEFNYRANNNFNHQDWQTVYGYDADDKPFVIDHPVSGVTNMHTRATISTLTSTLIILVLLAIII